MAAAQDGVRARPRPHLSGPASRGYSVVGLAGFLRACRRRERAHAFWGFLLAGPHQPAPTTRAGTTAPPPPQASIFEQAAALTEAQQEALDVIAASCSQRPLPKQVRRPADNGRQGGSAGRPGRGSRVADVGLYSSAGCSPSALPAATLAVAIAPAWPQVFDESGTPRSASSPLAAATPGLPGQPGASSPTVAASAELPSFVGTSFEDVVLQNSSDFYRWALGAARLEPAS